MEKVNERFTDLSRVSRHILGFQARTQIRTQKGILATVRPADSCCDAAAKVAKAPG
jgi:hypothetical protein